MAGESNQPKASTSKSYIFSPTSASSWQMVKLDYNRIGTQGNSVGVNTLVAKHMA